MSPARNGASSETSLVCMLVVATLMRSALDVGSTFSAILSRTCSAFSRAFMYPSTTTVGWTSWLMSSSAFSRSAPARMTPDVVPSPTSLSVALLISTIIFAAGCWTSISFSIVAPSLVMVTSPSESTSILSMPLGPREVFTSSAISFAAWMLLR